MSTVKPLPIEITHPEIPPELSPQDMPIWVQVKPRTWVHEPIPVEIKFPLVRPMIVPLQIKIGGLIFELPLELTALENVPEALEG